MHHIIFIFFLTFLDEFTITIHVDFKRSFHYLGILVYKIQIKTKKCHYLSKTNWNIW